MCQGSSWKQYASSWWLSLRSSQAKTPTFELSFLLLVLCCKCCLFAVTPARTDVDDNITRHVLLHSVRERTEDSLKQTSKHRHVNGWIERVSSIIMMSHRVVWKATDWHHDVDALFKWNWWRQRANFVKLSICPKMSYSWYHDQPTDHCEIEEIRVSFKMMSIFSALGGKFGAVQLVMSCLRRTDAVSNVLGRARMTCLCSILTRCGVILFVYGQAHEVDQPASSR